MEMTIWKCHCTDGGLSTEESCFNFSDEGEELEEEVPVMYNKTTGAELLGSQVKRGWREGKVFKY